MGGEYRYQSNASSWGNLRLYQFSQNETQFTDNGVSTTLPESRSFQVLGSLVQSLGGTVRARARVDYFSDITTEQLYQQNIHYSTRAARVIDGGVSAGVGWLSTSAQYMRNEIFDGATRSTVLGSTPRLTAIVAPQRLLRLPVYASLNTDFAYLPYRTVNNGVIELDNSLGPREYRSGAARAAVDADLSVGHADRHQPDDILLAQPRVLRPAGIRFAGAPGADRCVPT